MKNHRVPKILIKIHLNKSVRRLKKTLLNASMQQSILDIKQKSFVNVFLVFSIEGTSVGAPEGYLNIKK